MTVVGGAGLGGSGRGGPAYDGTLLDSTLLDELLDDAHVPLARIHDELDAIESRTRRLGDSPRPVHQARHRVARHVGDVGVAQREFELWVAARRDLSSGCAVCERGLIGDWHAERGEDGRAFEAWDALFRVSGAMFCDVEPHGALGRSLVPLIRLGRGDEARANHVNGYRVSRLKASMSAAIGQHIEFCALTGNLARGLELLAEHGHWLGERRETQRRAEYLGGVEVLLRVLGESGFDEAPFAVVGGMAGGGGAVRPLGELREEVGDELSAIAARFDERNGTPAFSRRLLQRRSRQPFLSSLPLGGRTTLPQATRRGFARATRLTPKPVRELVAEARRLTLMWHPGAVDAWRRVRAAAGASGQALPEDVQVELDEQMVLAESGASLHESPEVAAVQYAQLTGIADRYEAQGRRGQALRAASRAAFALLRGGRVDEAASSQAGLRLAAADALAGREITPREYMAVRIGSGYQRFNVWLSATQASGTSSKQSAETLAPATAAAAARDALEELGELVDECRRFRLSLHGAASAAMAAEVHLGCGDAEAAEEPLRLAVSLYHDGGAPWSAATAELNLSQLARSRGDLAAAERYARAAVEHNLDLELRGPAAMMLAEAIWMQDGREGEAVAPALAAAAAFSHRDGASHDEARAQLRAAEALAVVGRHDEAVALFEPALRVLEDCWDEDEWKPVIAQAARAYGNSLMAVDDPRRAAELLLSTAERVRDWPNQVPHAMLAGDAATALERAGRYREAAAAFQRAADLWRTAGEPLVRIKCLRSASWLLAGEDLDAALGLMDRAGGELVASLADGEHELEARRLVRQELAETHVQRARIVLNLADEGLLPDDRRPRLIEQARQEITGAINGLRRLVADGDGDEEADESPTRRLDSAMAMFEELERHRACAGVTVR